MDVCNHHGRLGLFYLSSLYGNAVDAYLIIRYMYMLLFHQYQSIDHQTKVVYIILFNFQ